MDTAETMSEDDEWEEIPTEELAEGTLVQGEMMVQEWAVKMRDPQYSLQQQGVYRDQHAQMQKWLEALRSQLLPVEVGARIIVCGMEAGEFLARLNGILGTVVEQDLHKDNFKVRLDTKVSMWLPRKRLRPVGAATAARAHAVERVAEESQHVTEDKELEEYALHAAITASLITAQEAQAAASVESRQRQAAPGAASAPRPQRPPWKAGDRVRLVNVNRIIAHLNGETGIVTDTVLKADGRTSVRVKLDSEDPRSLRSSWYAADSLEPE
jgi:hypothetical protein